MLMKTCPISGETPIKWAVSSGTSRGRLLGKYKERRPESKKQQKQAYVFVKLDLSDLWLRGLGAYLKRQVVVRRLQVIDESR